MAYQDQERISRTAQRPRYPLPKGFKAVVYGLNLTNEVFGFSQSSPIYPIQREHYRQTVGAGLRSRRRSPAHPLQ
jgi:hypothetical protein